MRVVVLFVSVLLVIGPSNVALAWSEGGHHVIASIAYKLLSKEEQAKVQRILAAHPRYTEDFQPKKPLPNDEELAVWRFGRAAYWPDVARSQPKYHRSTWHYELGPINDRSGDSALFAPDRPGPLPESATLETKELYASQAIELCRRVLKQPDAPESDKAIALCWIGHLVADVHQPCHSGSLYLQGVFEAEDGDRGANRIPTKQKKNMHALWDQLLGEDFTLNGTRKRVLEITSDEELQKAAKQAMEGDDALDPQRWLQESRDAAKRYVYTQEVFDALTPVQRKLIDKPEAIDLPEAYLKNGGMVAQLRAIQAGHRLATLVRQALK